MALICGFSSSGFRTMGRGSGSGVMTGIFSCRSLNSILRLASSYCSAEVARMVGWRDGWPLPLLLPSPFCITTRLLSLSRSSSSIGEGGVMMASCCWRLGGSVGDKTM